MLTIEDAGVAPPSRNTIELKIINRREMDEFVFDDKTLNEHLKNKSFTLPSQRITALHIELEQAEAIGDFETVQRLEQEIKKAEAEHKTTFREKVNDKISTSIYSLNQRNRKKNTQVTHVQQDVAEDLANPFKRKKTESTLITLVSNFFFALNFLSSPTPTPTATPTLIY
jgi:hypothetical protein